MGEERSAPGAPVDAAVDDDVGVDRRPWWRREARSFVELFALTGFAVAQPVLGAFGESPETFVTAGASPAAIVLFGVAVVLLPALVLWAVGALSGVAGAGARRMVQTLTVGLLVTVIGLLTFRELLSRRPLVVAAAVFVGALAAVSYRRLAAVRIYLSFASVAPVAFLALFLGVSPVHLLVFEPEPVTAAAGGGGVQPSVVVIVLDELATASLLDGSEEIDRDLFPDLARFADDATFFRNNSTVATHTDAALPALLTGRYPSGQKAVQRDYSENLFTLLADSHELNVHEAITSLCPASSCERRVEGNALGRLGRQAWRLWTGLVRGSDRPVTAGPVGATAPGAQDVAFDELMAGRFDQAERFIDSLERKGRRPRLDMVHLLFPHQPWELLPDGRRYRGGDPLSRLVGYWTNDSGALLGRQRHLLQARYADALLGRVLDRLVALDRYDESMVVVVADHGVSFQKDEHHRGGLLTPQNAPEILWTPLLVKPPGQTGGEVAEVNTQTVDVVPTIADVVGVDVPWEVDGGSLLDGDARPAGDKRYLPGKTPDGQPGTGGGIEEVDGIEGYEAMLDVAPPSAVPSDDPLALYRLPPYTDLTGTPVADLPQGPPADVTVRLDDADRFTDVDPDADTVPVYITGPVEAEGAEDRTLVVSVNGVIGGWGGVGTDFAKEDWPHWFGVVVPPSLFRPGSNTVEVFALEGQPGSETLRPVELTG